METDFSVMLRMISLHIMHFIDFSFTKGLAICVTFYGERCEKWNGIIV